MKHIVGLLFLLFSVINLWSGELKFSTSTPQVAGEVLATYSSDSETGNYFLLVYHLLETLSNTIELI